MHKRHKTQIYIYIKIQEGITPEERKQATYRTPQC